MLHKELFQVSKRKGWGPRGPHICGLNIISIPGPDTTIKMVVCSFHSNQWQDLFALSDRKCENGVKLETLGWHYVHVPAPNLILFELPSHPVLKYARQTECVPCLKAAWFITDVCFPVCSESQAQKRRIIHSRSKVLPPNVSTAPLVMSSSRSVLSFLLSFLWITVVWPSHLQGHRLLLLWASHTMQCSI